MTVPIGFVDAWISMNMAGDPEPMWTALGWEVESPPFTNTNAEALITFMASTMTDTCSNDVTFTGGICRVGSDGADIVFDVGLNLPGNISGASLPNNCAVLVRKQTALGGRAGRGRMFLPGITAGVVTGAGAIGPTTVSSWQLMVDALFDGGPNVTDGNVSGAVLFHQAAVGPTPAPTPIVGLSVQPRIATQRRRLR